MVACVCVIRSGCTSLQHGSAAHSSDPAGKNNTTAGANSALLVHQEKLISSFWTSPWCQRATKQRDVSQPLFGAVPCATASYLPQQLGRNRTPPPHPQTDGWTDRNILLSHIQLPSTRCGIVWLRFVMSEHLCPSRLTFISHQYQTAAHFKDFKRGQGGGCSHSFQPHES